MFFQKVSLKKLRKSPYKLLKFFSSLIRKTFKAVLIQISFAGIIQDFFYVKPTLLTYVLQSLKGKFPAFYFFNPIFDLDNICFCFHEIQFKQEVWKMRILLEIVRTLTFVLKHITDKMWRRPIDNFINFICKILNISIVTRDRTIFS